MKFSSFRNMPRSGVFAILACVFAVVSIVCAINVNVQLNTMLKIQKKLETSTHHGHITMMRSPDGGYILALNGVFPDECNSTLQEALRERFLGQPGGSWDAIYVNHVQVDIGPGNASTATNPAQSQINAAKACFEAGTPTVDVRLVSNAAPANGQLCPPGQIVADKDGRPMVCAVGQMTTSTYGSITTAADPDGKANVTDHGANVAECEADVVGAIKSEKSVDVYVNGKPVDADPKTIVARAHEACTAPGQKLVDVRLEVPTR